jgi:hypothetical protein
MRLHRENPVIPRKFINAGIPAQCFNRRHIIGVDSILPQKIEKGYLILRAIQPHPVEAVLTVPVSGVGEFCFFFN